MNIINISRVFALAALAFVVAMAWTPLLTHFLYKFKLSKKLRKLSWDKGRAKIFRKLHRKKEFTPTMGGLLIWLTVLLITLGFNLSRSQTWLPLFFLVTGGAFGLLDDILNVKAKGEIAGLGTKLKFLWQFLIAGFGAWWFFYKLGYTSIFIPGVGDWTIGWLYIPLFILTVVFMTNAVNITDGLDGLAGGLLASSFGAYAVIAFTQGSIGLAVFCATILGALLAFLWFNIYPARFFMGDTGSLALGATLAVVAMLTDAIIVLPLIGFVFVIEGLSSLIQRFWKRYFKRKVFLIAPIHHHYEAKGWPETKVTMRFWVIGMVTAIIGLLIGLIR